MLEVDEARLLLQRAGKNTTVAPFSNLLQAVASKNNVVAMLSCCGIPLGSPLGQSLMRLSAVDTFADLEMSETWQPSKTWQPDAGAARERMRGYLSALGWRGTSRPPRLLYLSCHGPLEHDELTLFGELGWQWVCVAEGSEMSRPRETVRTQDLPVGCALQVQDLFSEEKPDNVPQELLDWADVVVVMHRQEWVRDYTRRFGKKPVIWRSIGQAVPENLVSDIRKRIFCVRMSPHEEIVAGSIGVDATVRFYKDPEEFTGWTGSIPRPVSVLGMPRLRQQNTRVDVLEQLLSSAHDGALFGLRTETDLPHIGLGSISYEQLKQELRLSRAFVTVGTYPGPYTLSFIEALMTGCPVITIGPELWSARTPPNSRPLYEMAELLDSEEEPCGVWSDDLGVLQTELARLLVDWNAAAEYGQRGRALALKHFSKNVAKKHWDAVLGPIKETLS